MLVTLLVAFPARHSEGPGLAGKLPNKSLGLVGRLPNTGWGLLMGIPTHFWSLLGSPSATARLCWEACQQAPGPCWEAHQQAPVSIGKSAISPRVSSGSPECLLGFAGNILDLLQTSWARFWICGKLFGFAGNLLGTLLDLLGTRWICWKLAGKP